MLCVIPLQDWLSCSGRLRYDVSASMNEGYSLDRALSVEQINNPADPRHYWRYRMHVSIEKMLADSEFCEHLGTMVRNAFRF